MARPAKKRSCKSQDQPVITPAGPGFLRRHGATICLLAIAIAIPAALVAVWPHLPALGAPPPLLPGHGTNLPATALTFEQKSLGASPKDQPLITHVQVVDLESNDRQDILVCDARRGRVLWYRQISQGQWEETPLGDRDLAAPCHTAVADLDGDGDRDIVVAVLGSVWPTDDFVGRVVWLENRGDEKFTTRILLDDIRRIADVQPGDLDGDGDQDLVVAEFGYDHGRIFWLENRGAGQFRDRELLAVPGTIHVPIADFDGDGDLDFAALVSQEEEQVVVFVNQGQGTFEPRQQTVFASPNFDLGSSGLFLCDLNQDGKQDLFLTAGDNLEIQYPAPQPWHGCLWLENQGNWKFAPRRLASVAGVYAAAAADLDGDRDQDVVLACMFNDWRSGTAASLAWLENDGRQNFTPWQLAASPTHLATVDCGDLDGDGREDIVAGSLHLHEPFDRLGRVSLWLGKEAKQ